MAPSISQVDALSALGALFQETRNERLEERRWAALHALSESPFGLLEALSPTVCAAALDACRLGSLDDPTLPLAPPMRRRLRDVRRRLSLSALRRRAQTGCVVATRTGWAPASLEIAQDWNARSTSALVLDHGRQRVDGAARMLGTLVAMQYRETPALIVIRTRLGRGRSTLCPSWQLAGHVMGRNLAAGPADSERVAIVGRGPTSNRQPPPDVRQAVLAAGVAVPAGLSSWVDGDPRQVGHGAVLELCGRLLVRPAVQAEATRWPRERLLAVNG